MSKLFTTVAVLAALCAPAYARPPAQLPAVMLGVWCEAYGNTLFDETGKNLGRAYTHSRAEVAPNVRHP
jgi:hypothetical protein